VPVAHNAGEFWPRHSYIKWPGTITVRIGPVIHAYGGEPDDINKEVETWIENQMQQISDPARWNR
ncbi:MAG TPA: 1-acyl-sn-glycerol-3-phosphate acyltransferase, partial [Gammaproteobacteria bacterium]